jgi:hypothetical protein
MGMTPETRVRCLSNILDYGVLPCFAAIAKRKDLCLYDRHPVCLAEIRIMTRGSSIDRCLNHYPLLVQKIFGP